MADFDLAIVGGGINGAGHCPRCRRPRAARPAGRAERSCLRHIVGLDQAHPWRPALSRARMVPAGARGADRARGDVADGAAPDPADALRAAGRAGPAPGLDAAPGSVRLRSSRRAEDPAARPAPSTLADDPLGTPLKRRYERGFEYSDCWVDDARLVVLNALDAAERGATIRTRTRCIRAERGAELAARARRAGPARSRHRARPGQRDRTLAQAVRARTCCATRRRRRRGSTRAATSWCGACSTTIAATSSRPAMAGSCSRCRLNGISR